MEQIFLILLIIIQGAAGIIGQLIILRELPSIFYGNELSLGIILTSWLFWAAIGSGFLGRFSVRLKNLLQSYSLVTIAATFIAIAMLITIRSLRSIVGLIPGEIVSFPLMVITSFLIVAPYSLLQGFTFTLLPRLFLNKKDIIRNTNGVYSIEALGALIGCLYYYFFGIRYFNSFQTILIANSFLLLALALLMQTTIFANYVTQKKDSPKKLFRASSPLMMFLLLILAVINIVFIPHEGINNFFYKKAYAPLTVLDSTESIYGTIVTTKQRGQSVSFFENGLRLFSTDDVFSREESTAFALLSHPAPRHVLLLAGGISGCIEEILAHPSVEKITYVELDPLLVEKAKQHVSPHKQRFLTHQKVTIHYGDARYFIKNTRQSFDVIISLLPEPYTLQINRFYTKEFFHEVSARLHEGGIFSFLVTSSESFINDEQARFLTSLHKTLQSAFSTISIIPGNNNVFLATNRKGELPIDSATFLKKIHKRGLTLEYINEHFLPTRLSHDKIQYLTSRLDETKTKRLNSDFNPISYLYDMILWSTVSYPPLQRFITRLLTIPPLVLYGAVIAFFLLIMWSRSGKGRLKRSLLLTVGTVGLTEISLEIIIILLFQIFFGYVYSFIGIIIGCYMGGLAIGALIGHGIAKSAVKQSSLFKGIIILEACMVSMPFLLFITAAYVHTYSVAQSITVTLLLVITLTTGFIGGAQFPFVNTCYLKENKNISKNLGLMYAADLLGSSVGAFLISSMVMPLLGIPHTLVFLSLTNVICLLCLFISRKGV
ncbi:MAG: fused MFS/spermidine synthase [Candidatus Omnitrophica bacterium]|nr:fused MFS/spermidine synthase [Candidatus Omnitrophota bacterium]